jgi:hypothetical protein
LQLKISQIVLAMNLFSFVPKKIKIKINSQIVIRKDQISKGAKKSPTPVHWIGVILTKGMTSY